ncbi:MAG: helix-turn-helix transcriptional regulator [Ruminococcaceae bacterium]|nr:helix-turn-helix transcriptional regulator [Oscillospiraceae bacterium]
MILADKIIRERKRLGLSQEELAEKMNVSRQAVSKWEGGQSIPEIEKILQLSSLFGVTTDYLLKDEIEAVQYTPPNFTSGVSSTQDEPPETEQAPVITPEKEEVTSENSSDDPADTGDTGDSDEVRKITVKDAEEYISWRRRAAKNIALGVFLCILSAAIVIFTGISLIIRNPNGVIYPDPAESADYTDDIPNYDHIYEPAPDASRINVISGFLLIPLILVITLSGVVLLAYTGSKNSRWTFIETGSFEIEKAARERVREHQSRFSQTYTALNVVGAVICILSTFLTFKILPFLIGSNVVFSLLLTILLAGAGTLLFIIAGVRHASMQKLLKEGKYSVKGRNSSLTLITSLLYWVSVIVTYTLSIIFADTGWRESGFWLFPVVAVVIFPLVLLVCYIFENKHNKA